MNILLLNHSWLAGELKGFGHNVVSAGIFHKQLDVSIDRQEVTVDELMSALPAGFFPDRLVYYDDSGVPWLTGLERLALPKLFYSVDTHHHSGWHTYFSGLFDFVLVAQKKYLPNFAQYNGNCRWLPPWATVELTPAPVKNIDVCFRGTLDPKLNPRRTVFFERLAKLVPGDYGPGDYAESYPRAKVVVNQTVADDLNFRVFEALSAGALLVTPAESTGLEDLFVPGEDLMTYPADDPEAAASVIRAALADENERSRIAKNGHAKLLAAHTNSHRAATLNDILATLEVRAANPLLHFSAGLSYFFSFLVSELQNLGSPRGLLRAAYSNLLIALQSNEPVEETEIVPAVLHLCTALRQLGESGREVELFTALQLRFPASIISGLGLIDALIDAGDAEGAKALAERFNPGGAEALLEQVPELMRRARADLIGAKLN